MVPNDILENVFAYLSREDLDYLEIICLQWSKFIKTSKRLTQRRFVSFEYGDPSDDPNYRLFIKLKSNTGKTIRIVDDSNQLLVEDPIQLPAVKNIIIDALVENPRRKILEFCETNARTLNDWLDKRWKWICKLFGGRIIVKRVHLENAEEILQNIIMMKYFHDFLPKYIDAAELRIDFSAFTNQFLFGKESWQYLDFGEKTDLIIHISSKQESIFFWDPFFPQIPNIFPVDAFKEFISGIYMKTPKLNELWFSFDQVDSNVIFSSIFEAFCESAEPQKFFKKISTNKSYFDVNFFRFIRDDQHPQKYRVPHPRLNWALEVTKYDYLEIKTIEL